MSERNHPLDNPQLSNAASFAVSDAAAATLRTLGWSTLEACLASPLGEVVKSAVPGRDVRKVTLADGESFFLKRVMGPGSQEMIHEGSLLRLGNSLGWPVPQPLAFGASQDAGVLITRGLPCTQTLEQCLVNSAGELSGQKLRRVMRRLAAILNQMHTAGVNHRDFYAGHILLDADDHPYVLDFGRAERRPKVPTRRVVKDLAALHFSVPSRCLPVSLRLAFLKRALLNGREISRRRLLRIAKAVHRKAERIRHHAERSLAKGKSNFHVNR